MARTVIDPKCYVNLTEIAGVSQEEAGELEAILPYDWEYTYGDIRYKRRETVDIVTPLAEWEDFQASFNENGLSYNDFRKVEQLVRQIITAHCGQTFGKFIGTLPAEGNGLDGLMLSRKILSVTDVSWFQSGQNVINVYDPQQWVPDYQFGDPDFVSFGTAGAWEISGEGWVVRRNSYYRHQDPTVPKGHTFSRNVTYQIAGVYGWDSVPGAVQKAASLLIEDYICPDSNYRNKYLDSIKFDQHRLDYHQKAWAGTGNVMADQLLREFRVAPVIGVI